MPYWSGFALHRRTCGLVSEVFSHVSCTSVVGHSFVEEAMVLTCQTTHEGQCGTHAIYSEGAPFCS